MAEKLPVSVVIPAFRRADLVGLAVASALEQDPAPTEVIVVDDCSGDDTGDVAAAAGATVVRHEVNQGEGPARNTGIAAASQPWVAFLDSDDKWRPGHLARVWSRRADHVLVADAGQGTEDGRIYGHPGPGELLMTTPALPLSRSNPVLPSGALVRRDVALEVGGFTGRKQAADLEFLARVLERGTALALPDVGVDYYQHEGQVSHDGTETRRSHLDAVRSFEDRPWFTPDILASIDAVLGWDDLRTSLRSRRWSEALRAVPRVGGSPVRLRATLRLLGERRHMRSRIGER